MSLRDNPFAKLFNSLEDAERFVNQRASQLNEKPGEIILWKGHFQLKWFGNMKIVL